MIISLILAILLTGSSVLNVYLYSRYKDEKHDSETLRKFNNALQKDYSEFRNIIFNNKAMDRKILKMIYNCEPVEKIRAALNLHTPQQKRNKPE